MLPATHAGSWYPRGKPLTNMLTSAFETATVNESAKGKVKAIVVPHAGYEYCISTSTYAFKSIDPSNFNRCIIIGPSHRIYITHCTIADATTFETPYGEIPFGQSYSKSECVGLNSELLPCVIVSCCSKYIAFCFI